jgi:hypothetical protein
MRDGLGMLLAPEAVRNRDPTNPRTSEPGRMTWLRRVEVAHGAEVEIHAAVAEPAAAAAAE